MTLEKTKKNNDDLGSPNYDFEKSWCSSWTYYGHLGSTFAVLGWFRSHFEESLVTFVINLQSCKMYGKPVIFERFSWMSRCLEDFGGRSGCS